ncbi:helix-turn-helix domain-containing protein [Paenibacillus aquistagni]|uniref:Transcriptional regulator, AraC family n=1 Tax=Paenibacillus aquistagni TaxID=1852522 RepID=A0A1X7J4K2_9BACL|nr:AraC family transcriptional regulator [Paenibacillus aquistagni]SMG22385.1 transcriptional regulator, AraC family [Paenibacillus aquistagni]
MKPIRKRLETELSFPFILNFMDTKSPQLELPDHVHDWYELVYVHSGAGHFFIDHHLFDMNEGDLFIIPQNTIHRAFPDREDPVTSTALFFSPILIQAMPIIESFSFLQYFEQCRFDHYYKLECSELLKSMMVHSLTMMNDELKGEKPGFRHAVILILHQMIVSIHREGYERRKQIEIQEAISPDWMKNILQYIDANYAEEMSLEQLSEVAAVSTAHLSRRFKQLTGMNVINYIVMKRIVHAKQRLMESHDKVDTIAYASGFESLPHFHRTFKKIVGMTPAAYRREHSANTYK